MIQAIVGIITVIVIGMGVGIVSQPQNLTPLQTSRQSAAPFPTATPKPSPIPTYKPTPKPSAIVATPKPTASVTVTTKGTGLSNGNYYTNSVGNEVHSPAYSNSVPAGASAICGDGTYSFSQSTRGTCSHHSGVAKWL